MLHTIQNIGFGSFGSCNRSDSVLLHAVLDDVNLSEDSEPPIPNGPTQMTYLLFKFRLYELSARVDKAVISGNGPETEAVLQMDQAIAREQEMWNLRYLADSSSYSQGPLFHPEMQLHILDCYTNQLILLLHGSTFAGPEATQYSITRCVRASKSIIAGHEYICECQRFEDYRGYTYGLASFYTFHAVMVFMCLLLDPAYESDHARLYTTLEATLKRFRSVQGRSTICEQAAESLDQLLCEDL